MCLCGHFTEEIGLSRIVTLATFRSTTRDSCEVILSSLEVTWQKYDSLLY